MRVGVKLAQEVVPEQACVVRQVFDWVGRERATIGQVCRRLQQAGVLTQTGKKVWDRSTVWGMLKNPAYKGMAAFGKTQVGQMRPRIRPSRGACAQPKRAYSTYSVNSQEWATVTVPAIVDQEVFEAVQEQLRENQANLNPELGVSKSVQQRSKPKWNSFSMRRHDTESCG